MQYAAFVRTRHFIDTYRKFVRIKTQMCDTYDVTRVAFTPQAVQPRAASLGAIAYCKQVLSL